MPLTILGVPSVAWRRCLVLLAAALAAMPAAADWRAIAPQPATPIRPDFYVGGKDGSLWSFSDDGVRRTDSAGATTLVVRTASGSDIRGPLYADGLPFDDGAMLLRGQACALRYVDPQGRATWQRDAVTAQQCAGTGANASGVIWLNDRSALYRISVDGTAVQTVRLGIEGQRETLGTFAVTPNGGVVVASRRSGAPQRLTGIDRDGRERWTFTRAQFDVDLIRAASDGGVFVAARDGSQTPSNSVVLRVDANGTVAWTHSFSTSSAVLTMVEADGGDVHVVGARANEYAYETTLVARVGAGVRRWTAPLACTRNGYATRIFARDRDDGFAVLCAGVGSSTALYRWNKTGASTGSVGLSLRYPAVLTLRPDGNLLALGSKNSDREDARRTVLIDPGNRIVDAPINDYAQPDAMQRLAQLVDADGSSYVVTAQQTYIQMTHYAVTRFSAAGAPLWTRELEGRMSADPAFNRVAAGAGMFCLADHSQYVPFEEPHLVCLNGADGSERWRRKLSDGWPVALRILADGRVVHVRRANEQILRFAADGTPGAVTADAGASITVAAIDAAGRVTAVVGGVAQYRFDGTLVYRTDRLGVDFPGYPVTSDFHAIADDDGSAWIFGRPVDSDGSNARGVWAVTPGGTTRWVATLPQRDSAKLLLAADAVYVLQYDGPYATDREKTTSEVTRLDRATGAPQWHFASQDPHWYVQAGFKVSPVGGMALATDGRSLLLAHTATLRLRLQALDALTGTRVAERFIACDERCGTPAGLALDAAGTARMALNVLDRNAGVGVAALAIDAASRAAPATRLDQPGIAGAWWSPYANGEGITFDWLPASRTLFGAWFTYSTSGGNEPSELRWYTLQANGIADGTRRLELPILETTGGNFDAGPTVAPRRVGTAQVEFYDCTRGTIHYAFDAAVNEGRSGTITLSRLSPATQPCVLADGSTVPGAGAQPPANVFDAKLSGTWFDEATAGQGLQLTVQPNGVFFAPWFTFDPADAGNDAGRQHWFTLQGNLAEARDGVVGLVLVQTIGGAFDRVPTYNATAIGTATLRVQNCDRAELDYRFADESVAGAFRARSGTLRLTRAGGCAP